MDLRCYIKIEGNSGFLKIKVIPNAKETKISGLMGDGILKIRIKSIPEKGKANIEVINFISKELGVRKSSVNILSGFTSRNKLVKIDF